MSWSDGVKKSTPSASIVTTRSRRDDLAVGALDRVDVEVAARRSRSSRSTRATCAFTVVVAPARDGDVLRGDRVLGAVRHDDLVASRLERHRTAESPFWSKKSVCAMPNGSRPRAEVAEDAGVQLLMRPKTLCVLRGSGLGSKPTTDALAGSGCADLVDHGRPRSAPVAGSAMSCVVGRVGGDRDRMLDRRRAAALVRRAVQVGGDRVVAGRRASAQ